LNRKTPLEERVARLEANVEHIQKDVSDIKIDIRRLGDKIDSVDQKLSAKIDSVDHSLSAKIDSVIQAIAELKIGRALDRVWWLLMPRVTRFGKAE
jgi:predicted  nucleic acid-binding Zn-ribbon protein